ncbi:hypothetical protein Rsub_04153 [Raphidocelis subcapitata]|uniref:FAD dependent oxidoreductase domain-containing protein n=1 Tax=Raphidocelis subcapitata TaxID=307507 RepID=A0A2V0P0P3_9CHLO|nr:hypothetical protein Rsub_04153 [Raphidocelis subcapitata]|eukprot:GBF91413.1 hypothetical protein Rsub_04153 [Raphidocelis subcapitata]
MQQASSWVQGWDLVVIGDSPEGCLAAYSAAKAGRKVILLPSFGLEARRPQPPALQPLKLTHPSPLLAHMAIESAAYWRGLELLSDTRLLQPCASLDFVLDAEADHPGASAFSRLAPSAASAGARAALLRPDEARARLGRAPIALPRGAAALLQPDGGVLLARECAGAARALAARVGVQIKDRLQLRGWRDAGGAFFRVEASSPLLPDALSVFESESLLIAPGDWVPESLALFGLESQLETREALGGGWLAGEDAAKLPLWQFWGAAAAGPGGDPGAPRPCYGLPALVAGARAGISQLSWQGRLVGAGGGGGGGGGGAFDWAPADPAAAARVLEVSAGSFLRDVSLQQEAEEEDEEAEAEGQGEAAAEGGPGGKSRPRRRRRLRPQLVTACADGLPAVGWHPGFEAGRALVCCGASAAAAGDGGLPAFALSPVVAKLSADLLLGRIVAPAAGPAGQADEGAERREGGRRPAVAGGGPGSGASSGGGASSSSGGGGGGGDGGDDGSSSSMAQALLAARPAVQLRAAGGAPADTLGQLSALQRRRESTAEERERAADEASDRGEGRRPRGRGVPL